MFLWPTAGARKMKRLSDGTAKGFDVRISRGIARKVTKVLRDNLSHGCVARVADGGFRCIAHRLMLIELVSARLQVSSIFRLLLRQQRWSKSVKSERRKSKTKVRLQIIFIMKSAYFASATTSLNLLAMLQEQIHCFSWICLSKQLENIYVGSVDHHQQRLLFVVERISFHLYPFSDTFVRICFDSFALQTSTGTFYWSLSDLGIMQPTHKHSFRRVPTETLVSVEHLFMPSPCSTTLSAFSKIPSEYGNHERSHMYECGVSFAFFFCFSLKILPHKYASDYSHLIINGGHNSSRVRIPITCAE